MKGKKLLLCSLVMVICLLLWGGGTGYAKVTGVCSECHTMHNSQGGNPMRTSGPAPLSTPLSALLLNDCLGCHTTTGTDPFVGGYPFVQLASGATDDNCLAGGFFPTAMGAGDNIDNHHGIGNLNDPAGKETGSFYTQGATGLGCAGINGCHGNETDLDDMTAISGGHHNPSAYRILYVDGDPVICYGAVDYEELIIKTPTTTPITTVGSTQNVNLYSAGTVGVSEATISELCAKCHGDFHGTDDVGSSGAWIRHPSDVALPTGWTMGGVYAFDGDDAKNNPFGYDNAVYTANPTQVTCLSCHRAHGTANNDLLRWAYSTQSAGGGHDYGCLGCHNKQR